MNERNTFFDLLKPNYLFQEVLSRAREFQKQNPEAVLIRLGVGDTTLPLPDCSAQAMSAYAAALGTPAGYQGYGPYNGSLELRQLISERIYQGQIEADEIYVSDGSKCDIGRLQWLFSQEAVVAVQDPAYPVYVDTSLVSGKRVVYWPCTPENHFFPDLQKVPKADLIFFCSPNNPTGTVPTQQQLKQLIDYARLHGSIIVFDSAYAAFIQEEGLPKSIYELEGAREVAIESGSFSKLGGFTGVRLGWTVIPKQLYFRDGTPVKGAWERLISTFFNGASNIAQAGGAALLSPEGYREALQVVGIYRDNIHRLKQALEQKGYACYGGVNAPFLWVQMNKGTSWEVFDYLLEHYHIVATPGVGFGALGEGFVRFSGFASPETISEAIRRLSS